MSSSLSNFKASLPVSETEFLRRMQRLQRQSFAPPSKKTVGEVSSIYSLEMLTDGDVKVELEKVREDGTRTRDEYFVTSQCYSYMAIFQQAPDLRPGIKMQIECKAGVDLGF